MTAQPQIGDGRSREMLKEIYESDELLEVGRKAIEKTLIEWRDQRLSEFGRGNGLVIREYDGKDSHIIRFGPETALRIGLKAIEEYLTKPPIQTAGGGE